MKPYNFAKAYLKNKSKQKTSLLKYLKKQKELEQKRRKFFSKKQIASN